MNTTLAVILTCSHLSSRCIGQHQRFLFVIRYIFFLSFVLSLTSVYLLIVDVEGHCCTCLHLSTQTHTVGLLWTRDRPFAKTLTWQHTILTRDRWPYPWRDANPQSQQATDPRPRGHVDLRVCLFYICILYPLNTNYITSSQNTTKFIALCCTICYTTACFGPFLVHLRVVSA